MIVLDTNVYLDAYRDAGLARRLAAHAEERKTVVGLSSVVVAELLAGVRSTAERRRLLRETVETVELANVVTPTDVDWMDAGDALQRLGGDAVTKGRSFWNDLLIATSCARAGATLLTSNVRDFERISRVVPVSIEARPD